MLLYNLLLSLSSSFLIAGSLVERERERGTSELLWPVITEG